MGQPGNLERRKLPAGFWRQSPGMRVWGPSQRQMFMWTLQEHSKKYETHFSLLLPLYWSKFTYDDRGTCPNFCWNNTCFELISGRTIRVFFCSFYALYIFLQMTFYRQTTLEVSSDVMSCDLPVK